MASNDVACVFAFLSGSCQTRSVCELDAIAKLLLCELWHIIKAAPHTHAHTHAVSSPADRAVCVWGAPFSCRNWRNKIEQFIDLRSIWCAIIAPNLPEIKKKKRREQSREKRGRRDATTKAVCVYRKRTTIDGRIGRMVKRAHKAISTWYLAAFV